MRHQKSDVRFAVEHGKLVRYVTLPDGRGYVHRTTLAVLKDVAWYMEEHAEAGATTQELWEALADFPATQISVALDFLKERGCVVTECRRNYPASNVVFEDAMVEYYALEA
jgi:hypothetical protein